MTQELMDMARLAGFSSWALQTPKDLEAFAALVAAAEREALLQVIEPKNPRPCDCTSCDCGNSGDLRAVADWDAATFSAYLIRARGETK